MPANSAKSLISPDNHSLLMIDHQYLQMLTIRSHDAGEVINHAVALVEAAAIFEVPMLTTTAFKERQGLVAPLAEASKAVKPIWSARRFLYQLRCDKLEQEELLDGTWKEAYGRADCELAAAG